VSILSHTISWSMLYQVHSCFSNGLSFWVHMYQWNLFKHRPLLWWSSWLRRRWWRTRTMSYVSVLKINF